MLVKTNYSSREKSLLYGQLLKIMCENVIPEVNELYD